MQYSGMEIRSAAPADALAVARVHVMSWQAAYRGLLPENYLNSLRPEDRAAHYDFTANNPAMPHTLVAVDCGEILGFATTMPSRDPRLPECGELAALYVSPHHWRKGIGTRLAAAACSLLVGHGYRRAMLWVLKGNLRAEKFYSAQGWHPDGETRSEDLWGIHVDELRYLRLLVSRAPSTG
jgi:GNAT superfamily N-acetyltransferase